MKLKHSIRLLAALFLSTTFLASCLKDSDETIALEPGNAYELIYGSWVVETAELYQTDTHDYHSDVPEDANLGCLYQFKDNGNVLITLNGNKSEAAWSLDDENTSVSVNGTYYTLVSIGTDKMVWECSHYLPSEGETFILRYVLVKAGNIAEEQPDTPSDTHEGVHTISSSESGTIVAGGSSLFVPKGSVPKNQNNEDGKVTFSIQKTDDLPHGLPSGNTMLNGGAYKVEPMNFTFNTPLTLTVPLGGKSANEVALLRYNESTGSWEEIPLSETNGTTATAAVIDLGYFVVVEKGQSATGGIHINNSYLESGYEYYLTLIPTTGTASKKISFAKGKDLYMANVPLGNYTPSLSRKPLSNPDQVEYCNLPSPLVVSDRLIAGNGGFETYRGWTELSIPTTGSWINGRPDGWGQATTTYGTGKFQATLTWVNTNGSIVDYDLHLEGPNTHIYFGAKSNGYFELDRDWTSPLGNAIENIYSINESLPSGTYRVYVNLYRGAAGKPFNCRIILNQTVVKSVSGSLSHGSQDIYTFTIE